MTHYYGVNRRRSHRCRSKLTLGGVTIVARFVRRNLCEPWFVNIWAATAIVFESERQRQGAIPVRLETLLPLVRLTRR